MHEATRRWNGLVSSPMIHDRSGEVLFDPLVESWAFAGISESFRTMLREHEHSDQERALLVDRLRLLVQKRLQGNHQEAMLLYLAGYNQVEISNLMDAARSSVRRWLIEGGDHIRKVVEGSEALGKGVSSSGIGVRLVPLDTEDDLKEFAGFVRENEVLQMALGTFADLREALVIYRAG